jgi:signal transduction histidine kinase
MHEISRPSSSSAVTAVRGHDPPAAQATDSAETARRLTEDRDRIASEITDVVVRRLYSAGLDLQSALGLLDGHRAGKGIQHAITELDQAISDLRDSIFGIRPHGLPARRQARVDASGPTASPAVSCGPHPYSPGSVPATRLLFSSIRMPG